MVIVKWSDKLDVEQIESWEIYKSNHKIKNPINSKIRL
jgi:hypothetical protein